MTAYEHALALWRTRDRALIDGAAALLAGLPEGDRDARRLRWELEATRAHHDLSRRCPTGEEVRLWLDDDRVDRPAPPGWVHLTTAWEAMALVSGWPVAEASFDHDLGDDLRFGRGIDVLDYLEELELVHGVWRWPVVITLHSANGGGRDAMARVVRNVARRFDVREDVTPGGKPRFALARDRWR